MSKTLTAFDTECRHVVKPLELARLPGISTDPAPLIATIFQAPIGDYLDELVNYGPAWYSRISSGPERQKQVDHIPPDLFLDFAIGACEALDLLHTRLGTVHGEIRNDAFHFNKATGDVRLINFGSGHKAFDRGLTSEGWSLLARQRDVKVKLQFIAPEQTGRLSSGPDFRTDIYSLGVLFWIMLTGKPAFEGHTPVQIVQGVLSHQIPPLSSKRGDLPDAVSAIVHKMTRKHIDDRYNSLNGLKHDINAVRMMLEEGDSAGLHGFKIGARDHSDQFILPSTLFGREIQQKQMFDVIENMSRTKHYADWNNGGGMLYSISSHSSGSLDGQNIGLADGSSGAMSPFKETSKTVNSGGPTFLESASNIQQDSLESVESQISTSSLQLEKPRRRGSHRFRLRSRCEVIHVMGNQGQGKSALCYSLVPTIRRHGYFASAVADGARRTPFQPLIRAVRSLFLQIFSESDTGSEYHDFIRQQLQSAWPFLKSILDLPENLLTAQAYGGHTASDGDKLIQRDASMDSTSSSLLQLGNHDGPGLTLSKKSHHKMLSTLLDVLRILARRKLIVLFFDDLHLLDEETLNALISIINKGRIRRLVIIVTSREKDMHVPTIRNICEAEHARVTKVLVEPFSESEIKEYLAAALQRSSTSIGGLAAVVQDLSGGNPFFVRQMLETCHRKGCLKFSFEDSRWDVDLDKVFEIFEKTEGYGQRLDTNFITRLLEETPPASRAILAWASLVGSSFSFALIQRLLTADVLFEEEAASDVESPAEPGKACLHKYSEREVVAGLEFLMQESIIAPDGSDDEFRFTHDRYISAANRMRECSSTPKMHYLIAKAMMTTPDLEGDDLYEVSTHISAAIDVVSKTNPHRLGFIEILRRAARKATEELARPSAMACYQSCLRLLSDEAWDDDQREETLQLYTATAEVYWYQGLGAEALELLEVAFKHAVSLPLRARLWILQSRIYAQRGDSDASFQSLRACLQELGLRPGKWTWQECDEEYRRLKAQLERTDDQTLTSRPTGKNSEILVAIGQALAEGMGAAYWSDPLAFFTMSLKLMNTFLSKEHITFIEMGLGFTHFATIAISRFGDMEFGLRLGRLSREIIRVNPDSFSQARALTIYSLAIGHLQLPTREIFPILDEGLEAAIAHGDRIIALTSLGAIAAYRLFLGDDMAWIESFCSEETREFARWEEDLRGGVILIGVR